MGCDLIFFERFCILFGFELVLMGLKFLLGTEKGTDEKQISGNEQVVSKWKILKTKCDLRTT